MYGKIDKQGLVVHSRKFCFDRTFTFQGGSGREAREKCAVCARDGYTVRGDVLLRHAGNQRYVLLE